METVAIGSHKLVSWDVELLVTPFRAAGHGTAAGAHILMFTIDLACNLPVWCDLRHRWVFPKHEREQSENSSTPGSTSMLLPSSIVAPVPRLDR